MTRAVATSAVELGVLSDKAAETPPRTIEPGQRTGARVVGFLYLLEMTTAVFRRSYVRDQLIVRGGATKTAQNILGAGQLFRLSIAGDRLSV